MKNKKNKMAHKTQKSLVLKKKSNNFWRNAFFTILFSVLFIFLIGVGSAIDIYSSNPNAQTYITSNTNVTINTYNQTWLDFDGVNDNVTFGDQDNFSFNNYGDNASISIRFRTFDASTGEGSNNRRYLMSKTKVGQFEYQIVVGNTTTPDVIYHHYNLSGSVSDTCNFFTSGTDPYVVNQWYTLDVVQNPTRNNFYCYVNGKYKSTGVMNYDPYGSGGNAPLILGLRLGWFFNGSIDNFKVFNHKRTPYEIAQDYYINTSETKITDEKIIPVFMLHQYISGAVSGSTLFQNSTTFTPILNWLNSSGFKTITIENYYQWRENNNFTMPEKPMIFTWDDSNVDDWVNVAQLMDDYGYFSVMSLNTNPDYTSSNEWLNISNLIQNYSWGIVSHSDMHCHMGSATGGTTPTWCNSTATRQGNMSASYNAIISNTGIIPRALIFPWNDYGVGTTEINAVASDCQLNYTYCWGSANDMWKAGFVYKNSNRTHGGLWRIEISNSTTISTLNEAFGTFGALSIIDTSINENNGTIAYDSSGNGNNGTISGASWNNDGVSIANILNPVLSVTNNLLQSPASLIYSWIVSKIHPSPQNSILLNNTDTISYDLEIYNLTNALIYNTNGTVYGSTTISNNDGNINITLPVANSSYVLDNFNLTEGVTRANSPLTLVLDSDNSNGKRYSISSTLNETIQVPIITSTDSCYVVITLTPKGGGAYNPIFTCNDDINLITITNANISYSTSSNVLDLSYAYIEGGDEICASLGLGINKISNLVPTILLMMVTIVLVGLTGLLYFIYLGKKDISLDINPNYLAIGVGSIGFLIIMIIFTLMIVSIVCTNL